MATPQETIFYLEMHSPEALLPSKQSADIEIRDHSGEVPTSQKMYLDVGQGWQWNDRRDWNLDEWTQYHEDNPTLTFLGYLEGEVIGYFEFDLKKTNEAEIIYFGLLPSSIGMGLGGAFLTECVRRAWAIPRVERVWLHTCSFDHERALDNYKARGFSLFKVEKP